MRTTADKVILACKVQFACHGILDTVITDSSSSILRQAPVTHNLMAEQRMQSKHVKH